VQAAEPRHDAERHRGKDPRQHSGRSDPKLQRRKEGDRRGRDERPNRGTTSASPPKSAAIDPDSPFASLGALRDVLEKKMKETKSP
jgi:ATP-dependent RNA helicase SUPV3L1/SUV3